MRNIVITMLSVLLLSSCNAQIEDKKDRNIQINSNKPKIDYKVNKKYDDNGNLIAYDSVYTYYYSNVDRNSLINDSIYKKFNEHFNTNSSFFNDFMKQDEYLNEEFFSDDFFLKNYQRRQQEIYEMLRKMDSLKNSYLIEEFPLNKSNVK